MAQVPYAHVEAPTVLRIGGVIAFNPGDPVPLDTAKRLGLLDQEDHPPVIGGTAERAPFVDSEIAVDAPGTDATSTEATGTDAGPAPDGSTTTATPPQAPTVAPPQGRSKATPPTT